MVAARFGLYSYPPKSYLFEARCACDEVREQERQHWLLPQKREAHLLHCERAVGHD